MKKKVPPIFKCRSSFVCIAGEMSEEAKIVCFSADVNWIVFQLKVGS
jgi:hypothetical protein